LFDGMRHTTYDVWLGGGHLSFCKWGLPFDQRRALRYATSDRKSRMITICMLVGAVVMIGLAVTAGWRAITKPSQRACASDGVHRE
jgi:hypothetical protein